MNIEKLSRWLDPLMPDKIQSWMKARDMSDLATRQLIEKQIISTVYRIFGDPRKAKVLSLPPSKVTVKPLKLGYVMYDQKRHSFGLNYQQLLQHTVILGRSGAGKTNVVLNLFKQLVDKKMPVLFLDWKKNCRDILPYLKTRKKTNVYTVGRSVSPFPFNPFLPPPSIEPGIYIQHVVDVLAGAFTLGDGARSLIQKSFALALEKYNESICIDYIISGLDTAVQKVSDRSKSNSWKATALRALEELKLSKLTGGNINEQVKFTKQLVDGVNIVELDSVSQSARKFLVPLLFSWVYQVRLSDSMREKLSLVLILEEAHNVLHRSKSASESLTETLLRQCRELGIGVVLVDQQPSQLPSSALGNIHTSICLNLKDTFDISKAAGLSLLEDTEKHYLSQLEIGTGIVKLQNSWPNPFLVAFDHLKLTKGQVTDDALIRYMSGNSAGAAQGRPILPNSGRFCGVGGRIPSNNPDDVIISLVQDILLHPDDGVKVRYKRLNISVWKGNEIKEELLALGWIRQNTVLDGNTRKTKLCLTDKGRHNFGIQKVELPKTSGITRHDKKGLIDVGLVIDYISRDKEDMPVEIRNESLQHYYYKNRYANRLRELGYTVEIESSLRSGVADVVAHKGGQTLVFEIETGRSDFLKNLRHGLLSGFSVVVVATNEKAMQRIEKALVAKDLMIPDRVEIVFKDNCRFFE